MTQDEIIAWAKEFGLQVKPPSWGYSDTHTIGNIYVKHLEAFAKLVEEKAAAIEREAFKQIIQQTPFSNWFQADLIEAIDKRGQA